VAYDFFPWNGNLRKKITYKDGEELSHISYQYHQTLDDEGNPRLREMVNWSRQNGYDYKNGAQETYDDNGQLKYKRNFLKNKQNGDLEEYYKDGQLKSKTPYKDDMRDGLYESYSDSGQLKEKVTYKNNRKEGVSETYYDNGQLKEKRTWENNQPLSTYEMFYTNGQLKEKQLNGNLVESYLENGDPQE